MGNTSGDSDSPGYTLCMMGLFPFIGMFTLILNDDGKFIENIFEIVTNPNIIDSLRFVEGRRKNDIVQVRKVTKSDLHNHIPLGGSRDILRDLTGYYDISGIT